MGCITNAIFNILINGVASNLFHAGRGLRQGCPLPPMLFILIMEGLSSLMTCAKSDGSILGIKLNDFIQLTHLLFIDDVVIFLDGSCQDNSNFLKLFNIFLKATSMEPNNNKSTIILVHFSVNESKHTMGLFQFEHKNLGYGLKYLGFHLKPNDYHTTNWS